MIYFLFLSESDAGLDSPLVFLSSRDLVTQGLRVFTFCISNMLYTHRKMSDICTGIILLFGICTAIRAKRNGPWEISIFWNLDCRKRAMSESHSMPESEVNNGAGIYHGPGSKAFPRDHKCSKCGWETVSLRKL